MIKQILGATLALGLGIGVTVGTASAATLDVIALYNFENSDAADTSGNNNHGIVQAGVGFVDDGRGVGNTVASFNPVFGLSGIDTGIDINQGVLPEMTMGGWFNIDPSAGTKAKFMSHDNGSFDRTLGLDTRGGGGVAAFTGTGVAGGISPTPGDWMHVAVSYSKAGGDMRLFINGILAVANASVFGDNDSNLNLFLGANPLFNEDFTGLMDDVFVIGEVLDASQVTTLMNTDFTVSAVPVPAALPLLATALAGLGLLGRRRKTAR